VVGGGLGIVSRTVAQELRIAQRLHGADQVLDLLRLGGVRVGPPRADRDQA
jgi:hypothetical protein